MKHCNDCGETKPHSEFYIYDDKPMAGCKECRKRLRREAHAQNKFGISREEYDARKEAQGHRCAICGKHEDDLNHNLHLDHDHATGALRSFLCTKCNQLLGYGDDCIDILEEAIDYLRRYDK